SGPRTVPGVLHAAKFLSGGARVEGRGRPTPPPAGYEFRGAASSILVAARRFAAGLGCWRA
ncbi:MAG: hypothetical protein ACR2KO_17845, partial [Geodermatophilaceae bacterium]